MKKEPMKLRISVFVCNLLVIAMGYCGLMHMHYATDTYMNLSNSNAYFQLKVSRFCIFPLELFFEKIGLFPEVYQREFMLVSVLILAISSVFLFELLCPEEISLAKIIGIDSAVLLCYVNVFATETYLFPEYVLYNALGMLCVMVALYWTFKTGLRYSIGALVMLMLSLSFYQSNICIYLIVALGICWIRSLYKTAAPIRVFVIGIVASLSNIIIHKILILLKVTVADSREAVFSLNTIIKNLNNIIFSKSQGQKVILINGANLLPKGILPAVIIFLVCSLVFLMIYQKKKIIYIAATLLLIMIMYACIYAPHLIASYVGIFPRTITGMFFFIGILACMFLNMNVSLRKYNYVVVGAVILFFAINYWNVQGIIVNHFATNKIDQNYAHDILREIENYEEASGNKVLYIAPASDSRPLRKNHFIDYYYVHTNNRAFEIQTDRSDVRLINYISGREFIRVEMDDSIYNEHFADKEWDYYCPEEQLYFEGDTLYWCKY